MVETCKTKIISEILLSQALCLVGMIYKRTEVNGIECPNPHMLFCVHVWNLSSSYSATLLFYIVRKSRFDHTTRDLGLVIYTHGGGKRKDKLTPGFLKLAMAFI